MAFWWSLFAIVVVLLLAFDLGIAHRKAHVIPIKEALLWSLFWIGFALIFGLVIYAAFGREAAIQYYTGYIVEEALSVDNLFVFLVIFKYFAVPRQYQHKVLFWGIIGAIVMRGVLIAVGIVLIDAFHWLIYVLGLFLIATGVKTAFTSSEDMQPDKNPVIKVLQRVMPVTSDYRGSKFIVRENGRWLATPLLIVLLVIEFTDVVFALDSIPAILGITLDPFVIYTSNLFAILGLRALFFALAGMMQIFHYLQYGISAVLVVVGTKMVFDDIYHVSELPVLIAILVILSVSVAASLPQARAKRRELEESLK